MKNALLVASFLCIVALPAAAESPATVVELFTSEGCSSCPPADALLGELATRPGVLALSFHVDYWNGPGWTDPFSSVAATERQRRYAEQLDLSTVYTPQMVIDGKWQAVGSNRAEIGDALAQAAHEPPPISVTLAISNGQARIAIGAATAAISGAKVLLIGFDRHGTGRVTGGENGGRTLTHVDVVRGIAEIGRFGGTATTITAPVPWHADRVAAIVQQEDGRIIGVAAADLPL